ncbi:MAG: imidazole glycerol phosphate synthase subunit HisH [Porticoccaceae bacterium]|nr:imidazole glycerol phosphate synthase subunit HisH [Porticoccaceae bacterium]|tara:strand:- start:775 stop:1380 length:606 start_codon:yes stop_codon:yes gene_type:complete
MIGIIDYSINNIRSILNAIQFLQIKHEVVTNPERLNSYKMLILPGVGSFDSGVTALKSSGMFAKLQSLDLDNIKIFGICLGMQLLCKNSEEGQLEGLGLIDTKVVNLKNKRCIGKIPHVGFNTIISGGESSFLESMIGSDFYFVHSFGIDQRSMLFETAECDYEGAEIIAAFHAGNIFGTQFHPEKSGTKGLELIRRAYEC